MSSDNSAVPKLRSAEVIWLAASPADEASKGLNIRLSTRRDVAKKKSRETMMTVRRPFGSKYRE
jgi:hypothetical protein